MITAIQKPKRKYGEGSIYQRKDGRWIAKFKGEGMTKPRVVYVKSEPEAKRKLRELKKDAAKGIAECKKMLFCDYAERWLYTFKQHSVEDSSFDRYESVYLTHIRPAFVCCQLGSIRGEQLQKLLLEKSETLSYNMVKKIKLILTELFAYAHSESDIAKNPMHNVKMPKKDAFQTGTRNHRAGKRGSAGVGAGSSNEAKERSAVDYARESDCVPRAYRFALR